MVKKNFQRESFTEQVKSTFIDRNIEGSLLPDDRLKELQIAEEFRPVRNLSGKQSGVSRRSALLNTWLITGQSSRQSTAKNWQSYFDITTIRKSSQ